jgi:hypothetical protein
MISPKPKVIESMSTEEGNLAEFGEESRGLWEILVPTEYRLEKQKDGTAKYYRTKYHKVWDAKVRAISGGLTVCVPAKGQWVSKEGELFTERMIPVKIIATKTQINEIVDFTLKYYDQLAILAYKVSDQVILRHRSIS